MPTRGYYEDERWAAFTRVRRAFRWTIVVSVAAVGAIFGVVAHEIPGRSAASTPASGATSQSTTGNTGVGSAQSSASTAGNSGNTGAGNIGNTGASPPTPTRRAPTAVSGGTGW